MLPKIQTPIYEITLPISKFVLKYRPFLVKEQKILMIAAQSGEDNFISDNVKQIISNCCIDQLNIDTLSTVDIEYFFLHLRARSIGEVVEAKYRCENKIDVDENGEDVICKNLMPINIELLNITVNTDEYVDTVQITDKIGIKFKYPNYKILEKMGSDKNIVEKTFDAIIDCIDYIFDDDNFYYAKETPRKEMVDFIDALNVEQFKKIEEFFNKLPTLKHEIKIKCKKCGFDHSIILQGLESFLS